MNDFNVLIGQMAADISAQAMQLDDVRLKLFMQWFNAHISNMKAAIELEAQSLLLDQAEIASMQEEKMEERLKAGLKTWFESLSMQRMLWEYHLILDEMAWWRDLDDHRLAMILRSEAGK